MDRGNPTPERAFLRSSWSLTHRRRPKALCWITAIDGWSRRECRSQELDKELESELGNRDLVGMHVSAREAVKSAVAHGQCGRRVRGASRAKRQSELDDERGRYRTCIFPSQPTAGSRTGRLEEPTGLAGEYVRASVHHPSPLVHTHQFVQVLESEEFRAHGRKQNRRCVSAVRARDQPP